MNTPVNQRPFRLLEQRCDPTGNTSIEIPLILILARQYPHTARWISSGNVLQLRLSASSERRPAFREDPTPAPPMGRVLPAAWLSASRCSLGQAEFSAARASALTYAIHRSARLLRQCRDVVTTCSYGYRGSSIFRTRVTVAPHPRRRAPAGRATRRPAVESIQAVSAARFDGD